MGALTLFERLLAAVAAIVTLANFLMAQPFLPLPTEPSIGSLDGVPLWTRLGMLLCLECALAFAFGYVFSLFALTNAGFALAPYLILGVMSAWLSIWNVETFIFLGPLFAEQRIVLPIFVVALAAALGCMMIRGHIVRRVPIPTEPNYSSSRYEVGEQKKWKADHRKWKEEYYELGQSRRSIIRLAYAAQLLVFVLMLWARWGDT